MRCPACNTENPDEATTCSSCKAPLTAPARRKPRRRGLPEEADTPFSPYVVGPNRRAIRAYRYAVYGLIPGAGLFLGPLAVILGLRARWRGKNDPEFTAHNPARA